MSRASYKVGFGGGYHMFRLIRTYNICIGRYVYIESASEHGPVLFD